MRRRLLFSTLVVAITAVALFGIPLAFVMNRSQASDARKQVNQDAANVASQMQQLVHDNVPFSIASAAQAARQVPLSGAFVSISKDGGTPYVFGTRPPGAIVGSHHTEDFTVIVAAPKSALADGIPGSLALIASLAVPALGVAVGLGMIQARRLARPLGDLASAADRLGLADARPLDRRYGIPELDRVAEGLDGSARRISELLAAEREFATDASHQIRTPLTALSMRLEEILASAEDPDVVREEGAAALQQTERLAEVVGLLLGRTRRSAGVTPQRLEIDEVVSQLVLEWEPTFRRRNRKLEVGGQKNLTAYATPGTVAQVVSTLLDNALTHGDGTVTIRTSRTPKSVVIEVRDEGKGVDADLAPRIFERSVSGRSSGTGLGLALARSMAAADGGSVVLVRPRPAVFAAFVPREPPADENGSPVSGPA